MNAVRKTLPEAHSTATDPLSQEIEYLLGGNERPANFLNAFTELAFIAQKYPNGHEHLIKAYDRLLRSERYSGAEDQERILKTLNGLSPKFDRFANQYDLEILGALARTRNALRRDGFIKPKKRSEEPINGAPTRSGAIISAVLAKLKLGRTREGQPSARNEHPITGAHPLRPPTADW